MTWMRYTDIERIQAKYPIRALYFMASSIYILLPNIRGHQKLRILYHVFSEEELHITAYNQHYSMLH